MIIRKKFLIEPVLKLLKKSGNIIERLNALKNLDDFSKTTCINMMEVDLEDPSVEVWVQTYMPESWL